MKKKTICLLLPIVLAFGITQSINAETLVNGEVNQSLCNELRGLDECDYLEINNLMGEMKAEAVELGEMYGKKLDSSKLKISNIVKVHTSSNIINEESVFEQKVKDSDYY